MKTLSDHTSSMSCQTAQVLAVGLREMREYRCDAGVVVLPASRRQVRQPDAGGLLGIAPGAPVEGDDGRVDTVLFGDYERLARVD